MSAPTVFVPATFVSFRRSKRQINPNQALLEIDGVKSAEEAKFYVGRKAAYVYKNAKKETVVVYGSITKEHGNNGVVRAKFERNLPPQALGKQIRVMLSRA